MVAVAALAPLAGLTWFLYPASVPVTSVAVLPFVNTGGNAEADYLSDGITDTLIGNFSTLPGLKVKSSNAVRKYKGANVDAGRAGRELGVGKVVMGRVILKHGQGADNLSIQAELVDTRDNSEVWGENFERKISDILSIQRDITYRVAEKLKVQFASADKQRLANRETKNPEAYQLYLKGQYFISKFTKEGADKGLAYTQQAIEADPGYALAYEGLAGYYAVVSDVFMPDRDALPKAKAAAMKAIELDDGLAEAHADLASELFWYDYDWPGAEKEFRRALELNPNLSLAHDGYGWYLTCLGFQARGIEEGRATVRLDPLSSDAYTILSQNLYLARLYPEAEEQARRALELNPKYFVAHLWLALIEIAEGKSREAIAAAQNARQDEPLADWPTAVLSMAYAADGQRPAAEQLLKEMNTKASRGWVPSYAFAELYAGLHDKARTIDALERAYDERAWFLTFLNTAPEFDFVRSEARFQALLRRMKFPR